MKKDPTNTQRQAAARKRLIEEGGRRIMVLVPPTLNARLADELARTGESANATILRILDAHLPR